MDDGHTPPGDDAPAAPRDARRRRLETLRDRFVAISMRSRTLRLTRPSRSGALDLARLEGPRLLWLVKVLGSEEAKPGVIADVAAGATADAVGEAGLAFDVATLAHAARADRMETGADDLAVGWPWLEGRAADGTWLRAPLFLYPVALGQTTKGRLKWTLEPLGPPVLNEPLVQTLARLVGVRVSREDFIKRDDDGAFKVDDATWKGLYETLQLAGLPLHETAPTLPALAPLEARDLDARDKAPLGRFRLAFHLVLGRFPAAASTLVLDYDALLAGPLDDASLGLAAKLLAVDEAAAWHASPPPAAPRAGTGADSASLGALRRWQALRSDASQDDVFRFLEGQDQGGLVVQGPPGTGKSQLITNLVAASVARGERVLLVCQKRAALDVVADRLAHLGLADLVAVVHDVERDRNGVCQGIADTLAQVLDDSATHAQGLQRDITRAGDAHARAQTQVEARIAAHQAAWDLLARPVSGRPGLAALDERAMDDPGEPLPDLRAQLAELGDADVDRALPRLEGLAQVAAPLARPHPLWARTDWARYDESQLDEVYRGLRALGAALSAWEAVRTSGHLRPRDLDALAATFAEHDALLALLRSDDDAALADFLLFWGWCGGAEEHGEWARVVRQLETARGRLGPVPAELVVRSDAELEAQAVRFEELSALGRRWYRAFVPRFWALRGLAKRTFAGFAEPPALGDDRAAGLALLHREALPWQELVQALPSDSPYFDFGFRGDPAELDHALARVRGHHDAVSAVHRLEGRLERFGGPYAEPPGLEGTPAEVRAGAFVAALAQDARRGAALAAVDRAVEALRPHLDASWRELLCSATRDATADAISTVRALAASRGDGAAAIALDAQLAGEPAWVKAFLKGWRQGPGGAAAAAQRAAVWAWRQLALAGRPRQALVAPLVEAESLAGLQAAVDASRELTASGILARYRERLVAAAEDEGGRQGLQKLGAEVRKRRYRATLRQLIERHWRRGLDVARPVWLCSPESVASLFPLEHGLFDLVIFDEASQCPVESAVPALVRTRRAVIAGDDQQMPPSHFFRAVQEEDYEPEDDEGSILATQSILDLARIALPNTTLRWHYRCRHEALIAFSNAAFYGRKLATAPNAERRRRASWEGLHFERVDGRWVEQVNAVEAERVVGALARILGEAAPGEGPPSVGIVTFNKKQSERIEALIEARAAEDEAFRAALVRDRERPVIDQVFVRNLENVQGDERDVMLMSLGYGPSEAGGKVHARFGPLGQEGGDKRLNVAITRARLGLWLFASFEPEALGVSGSKHVGPRLLQAYLRFVRASARGDEREAEAVLVEAAELGGGRGVTARERRLGAAGRTGLRVREALAAALVARGYRVKQDVGLGRLSLDLAVASYEDAVFRVGIDCGAFLEEPDPLTRDLYVPLFWQRLGWTLLRVTPGQWVEAPKRVLAAIDAAVEAAAR